jgi:23S rRNA pseudouridine1911/1915/1917 synthase
MQKIFRSVVVPEGCAGLRFDQAAATLLPEFSRTRLKQWIDSGALTAAGARLPPKTRLAGGETLVLEAEIEPRVPLAPEAIPLSVVYEDAAIIVIDKPAGLVVHPGAGNRAGTLQNALIHRDPMLVTLPRAGLVHRLDKDTTGLMVVARTLEAQVALAAQIEARAVARTYEAVCVGVLTGGGTIEAPLGRHPRERTRMSVREGGRPARTHFRVLERFRAHTHVELTLETGRTHQIRVHMAHIRSPLVGDPVYGGRPKWPPAPSPALVAAVRQLGRQALHAARLALDHPSTGARMAFTSPVPSDFAALLAALREDHDDRRDRA